MRACVCVVGGRVGTWNASVVYRVLGGGPAAPFILDTSHFQLLASVGSINIPFLEGQQDSTFMV